MFNVSALYAHCKLVYLKSKKKRKKRSCFLALHRQAQANLFTLNCVCAFRRIMFSINVSLWTIFCLAEVIKTHLSHENYCLGLLAKNLPFHLSSFPWLVHFAGLFSHNPIGLLLSNSLQIYCFSLGRERHMTSFESSTRTQMKEGALKSSAWDK